MKHNHGQEIVLNRVRLTTQNLFARVGLSLFLALALSVAGYATFAPQGAIKNVIGYGGSHLLVTIKRQAPNLLRMHPQDLERDAYYAGLIKSQSGFWTLLGFISGGVFAFSFASLSYHFRKRGKVEQADQFKRGSRILTAKEHNQIIRDTYGAKPPLELGQFLSLGKEQVLVPEALTYRHFAFVGASGYGKTTAIEELMAQVMGYGHKGLVLDIKGGYYAKFGRPGDRILSLYDKRSEAWDFWHEPIATPEKLAAAMIQESSDSNQFFWKGARAFLASLLRGNKDMKGLWRDFHRPMDQIRKKLRNTRELSRRIIGEHDGEQGDAIAGTTVLDFAFLRDLGYWTKTKTPFSVTKWMNDNTDKSWVFVVVNEADIEIAQPLIRAWFDLAVLAALERDDSNPENVHTWLISDELKSVGRLPSLPHILDKGRKYKTSVVVGYQANSQIKEVYGDNQARSILAGLQNQFLYRMSDSDSAEEVSKDLGEEEVLQAVDGVSFGIDSTSDRGTISRQYTKKRLILADMVRNQPMLHCYAKICHHLPLEIHFSPLTRERKNVASDSGYPPPGYEPIGPGAEEDDLDVEGQAPPQPAPAATSTNGATPASAAAELPKKDVPAPIPPGAARASDAEGLLKLFEAP